MSVTGDDILQVRRRQHVRSRDELEEDHQGKNEDSHDSRLT